MRFRVLVESFRARLLLLLALMLGLTLGIQYYFNLRAVKANARMIIEQEQAIMTGVALGLKSLQSAKYLVEIVGEMHEPLLNDKRVRVLNIMVVDDAGNIWDSLNPEYNPRENEDKTTRYVQFKDVQILPLRSVVQFTDEGEQALPEWIPPSTTTDFGEAGAFYFPVETTQGRRFIIVVLDSANVLTNVFERQTSRSALLTLGVLFVTTLVTGFFVWRFTRPIKDLSVAARNVAGGNFDVQVKTDRADEMGTLATAFNEMTAKLGRARELEWQLHQAEKGAVVGRLAAAIAHEIRNPLNYINLTLDHLRSSLAPEDPIKRATFQRLAEQLKTEVARINRHISDFLKYSRPSTLELQPVDLRAEAEDALRLIEVQAAEQGVQTRVEAESNLSQVMADKDTLRSVFTNLIINGLQAIDGEGGNIVIRIASDEGDRTRIEISDTGRGIAPEDISKVFEPYYSTKETGTGLGLAIVRKVIEDHGGTVTVHSKLGAGTTFTIILPTKAGLGEAGDTGTGRRRDGDADLKPRSDLSPP